MDIIIVLKELSLKLHFWVKFLRLNLVNKWSVTQVTVVETVCCDLKVVITCACRIVVI